MTAFTDALRGLQAGLASTVTAAAGAAGSATAFVPNPHFIHSPEVGAALEEPGLRVVGRAKDLAPSVTGELADSIEGHLIEEDGKLIFRVAVHDWKGRWHEFGTVHMPAHPFLGPAAHDIVGNLQ